jgi:hypothetical protein
MRGLPPVLASARVIAFAVVDDTLTPTGRTVRFLGGRPPGRAPRLALGAGLSDGRIRLLHCDLDWNVLAVSEHESLDAAKGAAEEVYSGVWRVWQAATFTDPEVAAFLDEEDAGLICSFCGRHPHQYEKLVTGQAGAAICDRCITALRRPPL